MSRSFFINRDYSLLWSASFISKTGDLFYALALAWLVLERTRSPAMMGLLLVASYLPGFLISPWVGARIDRSDRKRILVGADLVRGAVVAVASAVVAWGDLELWHVIAVAVVLSVASDFFNPTARVVIPRIVPDDRLVAANANMQFISGVTSVAGPLLGALLLGLTGYVGAFVANALSFFLSAVLILAMRAPLTPTKAETPSAAQDVTEDGGIRAGFRFIARNSRLLVVLVTIFCVHLFFGSLAVVLPFLANALPGKGVLNLGLMEAALGVGMVGASLALNLRRADPQQTALPAAILLLGACVLTLGLGQAFTRTPILFHLGALTAIGACTSFASVFWTTLMQRGVPAAIAGRVFAIAAAVGDIGLPIAYGIFGLLLSFLSLKSILFGCGAALIILGLIAGALFLTSPSKETSIEGSTSS